jgi:predicted CopG family antitoxin
MEKITERVTISISKSDKERLEELKLITGEKTYSKVIQKLIRYGKL